MNVALLSETAWKSLLVGAVVLLLLEIARRRSAAVRATIAQAGLLALLVLPLLVALLPRWSTPLWQAGVGSDDPSVSSPPAVTRGLHTPFDVPRLTMVPIPATQVVARTTTASPGAPQAATAPDPWSGSAWWLAWSLPALLLLTALWLASRRLASLRQRALPMTDPRWSQALRQAQARVRCRAAVQLRSSTELNAPISCGWWRPAILLDARTAGAYSDPAAAEALLAHELAHIQRGDWLALLAARFVVALHWFNPLAWWLATRAHQLREEAADDLVLQQGAVRGSEYAALLVAAARRFRGPALAHGMAAGSLKARVRRVLDPGLDRAPARRSWRFACALAALVLAAPLAALVPAVQVNQAMPSLAGSLPLATVDGPLVISWTVHPAKPRRSDGAPRVQLAMSFAGEGHNYHSSFDVPIAELTGLDGARLAASGASDLGFVLDREAGSLRCMGEGRQGHAAGTCQFEASVDYLSALERHGLARPNLAQHLQLALSDVQIGVLDELQRQDYPMPAIDEVVAAGIHGLRQDWLLALAGIPYHAGSAERLIEFRIHGVDASYIQGLAAVTPAYARLAPEEVLELRIHGVEPEEVRALAAAGYTGLKQRELVEMAIHGAMPDYVQALAEQGYRGIPAGKLVEMRIHGVTPKFIDELAGLGYRDVSPKQLVTLQIHGVTPDFIRARQQERREGQELTVDRLVEMKIMGD